MKAKKIGTNAQGAVEYLLTYGWAILIVIITIGALTYFGVLNFSDLLPERCVFQIGIECKEAIIDSNSDSINLIIRNNLGREIKFIGITEPNLDDPCSNPTMLACQGIDCTPDLLPISVQNDGLARIRIGCDSIEDGSFKANLILNYVNLDSSFTHNAPGEIIGKAQAYGLQSLITDPDVCQNAENGGLCDGLDILFGEGYQAACCSEHVLCCG